MLFRPKPDAELSDEDRILSERIRAGDIQAFDDVARKHIPAMVRLAGAINPIGDVHEDIVQSVLARVWERRAEFYPRKSIVAYLMAAVRSHALDVRRQDRSRERLLEHAGDHFSHDETLNLFPSPDTGLDIGDDKLALRRAFFTLSERQRTVLHLRYGQDMRYAEVAAVLGITPKAVERLLAKSIEALRARMREGGFPPSEPSI